MSSVERLTLIAVLDFLRPRYSLEVGSRFGGSLAVLSYYSERVISLDIDPAVPERLKHFTNVEFVIGRSQETLPAVLARLQSSKVPIELALIDGDHSTCGVRQDCQNFLNVRPLSTLYILIHDSFNPDVREGIKTAGWENCPYAQAIELDFVPGIMFADRPLRRQMWGGFALAILGPDQRNAKLEKAASSELVFRLLYPFSVHNVIFRRAMQLAQLLR